MHSTMELVGARWWKETEGRGPNADPDRLLLPSGGAGGPGGSAEKGLPGAAPGAPPRGAAPPSPRRPRPRGAAAAAGQSRVRAGLFAQSRSYKRNKHTRHLSQSTRTE